MSDSYYNCAECGRYLIDSYARLDGKSYCHGREFVSPTCADRVAQKLIYKAHRQHVDRVAELRDALAFRIGTSREGNDE